MFSKFAQKFKILALPICGSFWGLGLQQFAFDSDRLVQCSFWDSTNPEVRFERKHLLDDYNLVKKPNEYSRAEWNVIFQQKMNANPRNLKPGEIKDGYGFQDKLSIILKTKRDLVTDLNALTPADMKMVYLITQLLYCLLLVWYLFHVLVTSWAHVRLPSWCEC
jgi:hypothetical protein